MVSNIIGLAVLLLAYMAVTGLVGFALGSDAASTSAISATVLAGGIAVLMAIGGAVQLLGRRSNHVRPR